MGKEKDSRDRNQDVRGIFAPLHQCLEYKCEGRKRCHDQRDHKNVDVREDFVYQDQHAAQEVINKAYIRIAVRYPVGYGEIVISFVVCIREIHHRGQDHYIYSDRSQPVLPRIVFFMILF